MTFNEIIIAFTIHLFIPLIGLFYYLQIKKRMQNENIQNAPTIELFIIFATYGGILLVALTTLFWKWSGMASLETFYLIFIAPIILGMIIYKNRKTKHISKYHNWIYKYGILYFVIAPLIFIMLYLFRAL